MCRSFMFSSFSVGFTSDSVEFEWFSDIENAIQLNRDLEIPELSLINVKAEKCDGTRKSGLKKTLRD